MRVLCELLAEDRVTAVEWSAEHLAAEARARGIDAPAPVGSEASWLGPNAVRLWAHAQEAK